MPRNVEIKARVADAAELSARAAEIADDGPHEIFQDDTFFNCADGRLKLRDFGDGTGELIFYKRRDDAGPKPSFYVRSETADPAGLRETLERAHGVMGRVRKRRTLYLVGRTRIHIDRVDGLGEFAELEVVLADDEPAEQGIAEASSLMKQLGIAESALIRGAYVDLLNEDSEVQDTPVSLEQALLTPAVRRDGDRLESLLHPDFVELGRSGRRHTREEILQELANEGELPKIVTSDLEQSRIAPGVVLVTYTSAHADEAGQLYRQTNRASIWLRGADGWRVRFHQGTPADDS